MRFALILSLGLAVMSPARQSTTPQTPSQDGPAHPFQDPLVEGLAGDWSMAGSLLGKPATYHLHADWVLGHQFLRLQMRDVHDPPAYEAHVYMGYDNASDRYVAHWIDLFGGRWSETLGFGTREGDSIRFVFEYPDGPFTTTFTRDPKGRGWTVRMRQKSKAGVWENFAEYALAR